jgi:hypothetical protein
VVEIREEDSAKLKALMTILRGCQARREKVRYRGMHESLKIRKC